jgi:hypothetical protein
MKNTILILHFKPNIVHFGGVRKVTDGGRGGGTKKFAQRETIGKQSCMEDREEKYL